MGFVLDDENKPYENYDRLIAFDRETHHNQFNIQTLNYSPIYETNNFDIALSNNTLLEFIYDIPVYVTTTLGTILERNFSLKIEYALDETNDWVSIGETEKTDGVLEGANYSCRLNNHIYLRNIVGSKIRFRTSLKVYNTESVTINLYAVQNISSSYTLLQYDENNYIYNQTYSSKTRKLSELHSVGNSVKNLFNTTTYVMTVGNYVDVIFPLFNKSPLAGVFVIIDLPIEFSSVANTTSNSYINLSYYYSNDEGLNWTLYASRSERTHLSVTSSGAPKLGQGGYSKTERFYLYLDQSLVNVKNLQIKVRAIAYVIAPIINPSNIDNNAKAQIKVYEIHKKSLPRSKGYIQSQPKESVIGNKVVFHKTDPITTTDLVDVDFVPVFETGDLDCEIGSNVLIDLCYSIKNGNSGNGSMMHYQGLNYNWPADAPTMTPIPPTTKIGNIHYNTGWFWNGPVPQHSDFLNDLAGDGANESWESENHVRVHQNTYPPGNNQNVFDLNTIIWLNYRWIHYTNVFLQQWWACEPVGWNTASSQEANVKHSENGTIIKIEYSINEGASWDTYIENNITEGKNTLYPNRITTLGDIRIGGTSKGMQSTYAASNNNNKFNIKKSLLLENISSNKIRFRISAKSIPKQIFRAVYANVNSIPYTSLFYNLPYSFAQWSLPNNEAIAGDSGDNYFTIHASLTEVKQNT